MSITFAVSPVTPCLDPVETHPIGCVLEQQLAERHDILPLGRMRFGDDDGEPASRAHRFEATGAAHDELAATATHAFVTAATWAYATHRPLALSPDHLWTQIALGVARHVAADPARHRERLVRHDGTLRIHVQRDDIRPGDPDLPWSEVVAAWVDGLRDTMGRRAELFVEPFSTTDDVARTVHHVVLMDAVSHFTSYSLGTLCGIPEITLEGEPGDWRRIRHRVEVLRELDLDRWVDVLGPIVDQFVAAAEGNPDTHFWQAFVKQNNSSGGPHYTGWIVYLFPYLRLYRQLGDAADGWGYVTEPNPMLAPEPLHEHGFDATGALRSTVARIVEDFEPGGFPDRNRMPFVTSSNFPPGLSRVAFDWELQAVGIVRRMELVAGFAGVSVDAGTGRVRPELAWGVRERVTAAASGG